MKKILFAISAVLLFALTSYVMKMKVISDYNKKTDFKKYKSFAWIVPYDTVLRTHIKYRPYGNYTIKKCDEELFKKGMVLDSINPDVVFMCDGHFSEKDEYKQSGTLSVGVGVYAPAIYGRGYYGGGSSFDPNGYNMGNATPNYGYANTAAGSATGYYGGYYYGVSAPIAGGTVTKHHVEEGELIINMYDTKTRSYIWGAVADQETNLETDIPETINQAVVEMMKRLPIKINK